MKLLEIMIHKISIMLTWIAAGALFVMMLITFLNVIGRYVFKMPIVGIQDLTEQFMILIVYGTIGYVTIQRSHISVDLIDSFLSKRSRAIVGAVANFFSLIIIAPIIWRLSAEAIHRATNLHIATATIGMPLAPFYLFAAFGTILLGIEMLFDMLRHIREGKGDCLGNE